MAYLVPIYCLITAITAVLLLLQHGLFLHNLLLTFYVVAGAILALAVGDDVRDLAKPGKVTQKMVRALIIAAMLIVAIWLSEHYSINLYYRSAPGLIWCFVGMILGFFANKGFVASTKRR